MLIEASWLPTAANINALPNPVRSYIHDLQTNADPAGMVRDNVLLKDENAMLQAKIVELQTLLEAATPKDMLVIQVTDTPKMRWLLEIVAKENDPGQMTGFKESTELVTALRATCAGR